MKIPRDTAYFLLLVFSILLFLSVQLKYRLNYMKEKSNKVETVAEIYKPDFSGIVVTDDNRIFLTFPQHSEAHSEPTLAEYKDGKLIPFPNKETTIPSNKASEDKIVSPHGMTLDKKGRLWVLDDGKIAGQPMAPGAAKVVCIDIDTKEIIKKIIITPPAMRPDTHLNDVRVDLTHGESGMIYITNSSFGLHPSLIIVDIETGKSRSVLENHYSTQPQPGFMAFLEGKPLVYNPNKPTFPAGGANGIELSNDNKTLYWTSIIGRKLYSISTNILSDMNASEETLGAAVKDHGDRPAADGITIDTDDNLYFGSFEHLSIIRKKQNGEFELIAHDERFVWLDSLFVSNNYIYITLGQWNRLPEFNNGKDLRKPPYLVVRVKIK